MGWEDGERLEYGMDGGGKRVMEEGLGGKMVEVLAGGGLCSLPVR